MILDLAVVANLNSDTDVRTTAYRAVSTDNRSLTDLRQMPHRSAVADNNTLTEVSRGGKIRAHLVRTPLVDMNVAAMCPD
jgi:hypothetical protein